MIRVFAIVQLLSCIAFHGSKFMAYLPLSSDLGILSLCVLHIFPRTGIYPRSLILTILDVHITADLGIFLRCVFFKPELSAGVLALTSAAAAPVMKFEAKCW